jgi:hypothetical protein
MNVSKCQKYSPDIQAQGDCLNCGQAWEAHDHRSKTQRAKPTERVKAIRRAAVAFASDVGPLKEANQGKETAQHEVATRLVSALRKQGLEIIQHVGETT